MNNKRLSDSNRISSPRRQNDVVKLKQKSRHVDTEKQDLKNNHNFDKDEINANQALGEVLRQAQNTSLKRIGSPFNMSQSSRVTGDYR